VPLADRWIFSRLARATAQVNDALEHFRFHEAAHVVYHFFWGDFCDWYIEWVKPELSSADRAKSAGHVEESVRRVRGALRLLHPFMPFLTEELWHQLPQRTGARSIALDRFPEPHAERIDAAAEEQVALLQEPPFDSTKGIVRSTKDFELFIAFEAAIDVPAEVARLRKEKDRLAKDIASKQSALGGPNFSQPRARAHREGA
jgi:valyl-tRNA synthetase